MNNAGWREVKVGDVLTRSDECIEIDPTRTYEQVTVRLWGKGVVPRGEISGMELAGSRRFRVRAGQFIMSRIDARHGAFGLVPDDLDGAVASNDFPSFDIDADRLRPGFLGWLCRTPRFVALCEAASEGTTNRVRVKEDRFLDMAIALPEPQEQDRIVRRLDDVDSRLADARSTRDEIEREAAALMGSAFTRIAQDAGHQKLANVAPLERRPVEITVDGEYPELGVRSFGRGVFHKPTLLGAELTWQKLFRVKAGDIVISNIKAWEGAIAVAGPDDDSRVGSHRYLTLSPIDGKATAGFLCFYLLTDEGLAAIGRASPGSADRNRTLGQKRLMDIEVPVPPFERQVWFDRLQAKAREMLDAQADAETEFNAMMPSILDRAFRGEL